ncbi:hypothetical protein BC827DRAFT_880320 [Russula dissimulans]|nr:hypothetical protein BC827DRAFT_880320 [Russula dissimulans]
MMPNDPSQKPVSAQSYPTTQSGTYHHDGTGAVQVTRSLAVITSNRVQAYLASTAKSASDSRDAAMIAPSSRGAGTASVV